MARWASAPAHSRVLLVRLSTLLEGVASLRTVLAREHQLASRCDSGNSARGSALRSCDRAGIPAAMLPASSSLACERILTTAVVAGSGCGHDASLQEPPVTR